MSLAERRALARAIVLAAHPPARTSPNPTVGCVLLRDGATVGEGVTAPPPGPHAEVVALRAAGARARGATAVVTLEPCAHTGRTPPCTDALLAAGVARVVIAHPDPHPFARGGAAQLTDGGVEVVGPLGPLGPLGPPGPLGPLGPLDPPGPLGPLGPVGPLGPLGSLGHFGPGVLWRGVVQRQLEGFLTAATTGRPHVTLKQALTADGGHVHPDGARWITGPVARRAVHRWRASVDAVLVGVGTVLADDPRLDVRDVPGVPDGAQPRPVVLDTLLRTPPDARVVARGAVIVTRDAPDAPDARVRARAARLRDAGAELLVVPGDAGGGRGAATGDPLSGSAATADDAGAGGLDLPAALRALTSLGIVSMLAEPGPTLTRALLDAGLVDRVVRHVAVHLGTGPLASLTSPPPGGGWELERVGGAGPDLVVQHVRRVAHEPHHPLQHEE